MQCVSKTPNHIQKIALITCPSVVAVGIAAITYNGGDARVAYGAELVQIKRRVGQRRFRDWWWQTTFNLTFSQ